MLALLYGAGLRRSEAAALLLADYDQMSGAITVRHDERQVYVTDGGKEAIEAWIAIAATGQGHCCARSGAGASRRRP